MGTILSGDLKETITTQLLEVALQIRQKRGYAYDPVLLKEHLQAAIEGKFVLSIRNAFNIIANLSLSDRITRGKYDWVNVDITQDHFPETIPVDYTVEWKLFHFNRRILSENAITEMEKEGFRPATPPELLAFGETYPNEQKQYPIIGLGSFWRHSLGGRGVPVLSWGGDRRELGLDWFEGGWSGGCRFLAVRK